VNNCQGQNKRIIIAHLASVGQLLVGCSSGWNAVRAYGHLSLRQERSEPVLRSSENYAFFVSLTSTPSRSEVGFQATEQGRQARCPPAESGWKPNFQFPSRRLKGPFGGWEIPNRFREQRRRSLPYRVPPTLAQAKRRLLRSAGRPAAGPKSG
jgi:hypothetical protein